MKRDHVWYDKEGEPHLLSEMNTRYIRNCIKFLERFLDDLNDELSSAWGMYMTFRGEMAQLYCGYEIDEMTDKELAATGWIVKFRNELKRRKHD